MGTRQQAPFVIISALLVTIPALASGNTGMPLSLSAAFDTVGDGLELIIPDTLKENGFRLRLGAGFGAVPDYTGSHEYRLKILPIVDLRYKERLRLTLNTLSYAAINKGPWQFGPLIKYKSGRKEQRNPVLEGLGNIKATAQVGLFAKYKTKRMLFSAELRQALGSGLDKNIRLTLGHGIYKTGPFSLALALRAKWMSAKAMQTEFGISTDQSLHSAYRLQAYTAKAGISAASVNLFARYDIAERYRLLALATYGKLLGDAARSPLVAHNTGDRNQFKIGVGFTIDF